MPTSRCGRWSLILFVCAFPRVLCAVLRPPNVEWGAHYWPMSTSLLSSGVLGYEGTPSTYYEPLYPGFLALARHLGGDQLFFVLALQALVGAVGGVYLYELASRLGRSTVTGTIAVAIYAFYPYLVAQAAALEEVTLLTMLLVASAYHYVSAERVGHSLACGVACGLALLTRTVVAPIVALATLALALRGRFARAFAVGGVALLVYLPYGLRNHRIDGSFFPTRSGFNLLKANCDYSEAVIPVYMIDVLNVYAADLVAAGMPGADRATESEIDRFYTARALAFVTEHPVRSAARWLRNTIYLFYPRLVPFHPIGPATTATLVGADGIAVDHPGERSVLEEASYTLSYTPVLLAALAGAFLRRRELERDLILYLIVVSFAAVYSISWPATRLRAPMDFVLILYAATAIERLFPERRHEPTIG